MRFYRGRALSHKTPPSDLRFKGYFMKSCLHRLSIPAIVVIWSFGAHGASALNVEPLWSVGIITDTQTSDKAYLTSLLERIKGEQPEMVVHIGDTYFDWSNQFVLRTVADMLEGTPGVAEFHLAPGNHDMKNGELKAYLRSAATRGVFRLDTGPTFAGNNYLHSRVAAYVPDPLIRVWNPEIVNHPAWQPDPKPKYAAMGFDSRSNRYVFKRGGIRFIICDWDYSEAQKQWIRDIITRPDDSSATIVFHHYHKPAKLAGYFEGLEGRHNVKLVLSGHDHRYNHTKEGGITYITAAGIARSGRDCDAMVLRVHSNYLRLDRYIIPKGSPGAIVSRTAPIWTCSGSFGLYQKPELPRRKPVYVKSTTTVPGPGVFYSSEK